MSKEIISLETWERGKKLLKNAGFHGVVIAISGGLDSTALFHAIWQKAKSEKNFSLLALHVNFGLRGPASDADQAFCEQLCRDRQVPLRLKVVTAEERLARQGGVQAWARGIRQAEFWALEAAGLATATGHHSDDVAETFLMRLARGASPGNLAGMRTWRPPFWRPLLIHTKSDLEDFARQEGLAWREDASNQSELYARNIIRKKVIPELDRLYPGAARRLAATAAEIQHLAGTDCSPSAGQPADVDEKKARRRAGVAKAIKSAYPGRRQLSRSLLDLAATSPFGSVTLPGGDLRTGLRDSEIVVESLPHAPKPARALQHRRALELGSPVSILLEPRSYALIRAGNGVLSLNKVHQELERATQLATYGVGPAKTAQAAETSSTATLDAWHVPKALRGRCLLVQSNGSPISVLDPVTGQKWPRPKNDWAKSACSQDGFDLRYFNRPAPSDLAHGTGDPTQRGPSPWVREIAFAKDRDSNSDSQSPAGSKETLS